MVLIGACQSLDYAGVKFVPGDYGSWGERLFVLFGAIAWDFKAAAVVSRLVMDRILDNVVNVVL